MLRTMYDDFQTGRVINVTKSYGANGRRALSQLRDFYGMEIVTDSDGGHRLVGEWEGPYYVPIERIASL